MTCSLYIKLKQNAGVSLVVSQRVLLQVVLLILPLGKKTPQNNKTIKKAHFFLGISIPVKNRSKQELREHA